MERKRTSLEIDADRRELIVAKVRSIQRYLVVNALSCSALCSAEKAPEFHSSLDPAEKNLRGGRM